jgi:CubicO group peptidase (beta-lactamase class C family)
MIGTLNRRTFLAQSCRAACFAPLFPSSAYVLQDSESALQSELSPAIVAYLDRRIPELLADTRVPGLSMAVVKDAALIWKRAYGTADVETKSPLSTETIFEAGSVSKTVFAYAVMKLCDRGVLSLDSPLTKYSAWRPLDDPRVDLVTVRRVLCHTTGLPNFRSSNRPLAFAFTPGERWSYSGEAYWYLQSVITELLGRVNNDDCSTFEAGLRVCATDIADYLKTNVLSPFGMTSSGYVWNDDYETRVAHGHDKNGRRNPRRRTTALEAARYAAIGGLHTTASEYAKFLLEVLDPKPPDAYRLNRATRDEMIRPQVKVDASSSWALGWQVFHSKSGDVLSHGGDNPGFKAFVVASAARKSGWVIFMNGDNAGPIIQALVDEKCPLAEVITGPQ